MSFASNRTSNQVILPDPKEGSLSSSPAQTTTLLAAGLALAILLGAFLRFYKLGAYSIGNAYYAATVKSMLTSWHDFFFAAYEPGGSVSVDKPPLGFWLQAASAYVFGLNGFALALPQALAGTLSIPLLFVLVRRQFGQWAGLVAALALAVLPVAVSTERNNTIDGLLVFVLLLAAWAFWQAARSGRLRYLFLGAVLVGLGFNIKMLQAFLPLPAFYLLYLLGARQAWWKRLLHLAFATLLLVVVSLSWAIAVDLTAPENRPFVGSSTDNTVMELIVGHNGLNRLSPGQLLGADAGGPPGAGSPGQGGQPGMAGPPPRGGLGPGAQGVPPPLGPGGRPPGPGQGPGGASEVGTEGWMRLFTAPLFGEAGWLLPVALLSIPLLLVVLGWQWPLSGKHLALVLWAGWLLPEILYFSFNSGLFHAYYLIMLGPPLAALVGGGVWALWWVSKRRFWLGWGLAALFVGVTLCTQYLGLVSHEISTQLIVAVALPLLLAGLALLAIAGGRERSLSRCSASAIALGFIVLSLIVGPLYWSFQTTFNSNPKVGLPRSGPSQGRMGRPSTALTEGQQALLDFVVDNTEPGSYLFATLNSHHASPFILATDRPVLTFGGFNGADNVVDTGQLAELVGTGELRYVLGEQELAQRKPEIGAWLRTNCSGVQVPGVATRDLIQRTAPGPGGGAVVLYDCAIGQGAQ